MEGGYRRREERPHCRMKNRCSIVTIGQSWRSEGDDTITPLLKLHLHSWKKWPSDRFADSRPSWLQPQSCCSSGPRGEVSPEEDTWNGEVISVLALPRCQSHMRHTHRAKTKSPSCSNHSWCVQASKVVTVHSLDIWRSTASSRLRCDG